MSDKSPSLNETIEWATQHHFRCGGIEVVDYCHHCLGDWPCVVERLKRGAASLRESLECLIHRCEAEGCGTAWAPITDAKRLLEEIE